MSRSLVVFAAALMAVAGVARAEDLPRYKLVPGDHLVYSLATHSVVSSGSGQRESDAQATEEIWVTVAGSDGSFQFLALSTRGTGENAKRQFRGGSLTAVGQMRLEGNPFPYSDLWKVLPPLAPSAGAAEWTSAPDSLGTFAHFQPLGAEAGRAVFRAAVDDPTYKIYLTTRTVTFRFDAQRGLLESADEERSENWNAKASSKTHIELKSFDKASPLELAQLNQDSHQYLQAVAAVDAASEGAASPADAANPAKLEAVEKRLKAARAAVKTPVLQALLDKQIADWPDTATSIRADAQKRADAIGKPAPEFTTTDLDGAPYSLQDLRGKVVVLDFWYRGCPWCILAMPQLKQVAEEFKEQPVALLGMNTDKKEEDARFVVKEMGLTYPTLKGAGPREKFNVRMFPTLIVIDKRGVVRDMHLGWSGKLHEELSAKIRSLLAE